MASYVLVHGAWHGGWCWDRLRVRLTQRGTAIYTRTLTGLGDRADLLSPSISLETQAGIEDYHELSTGHDAMVTAPRELAELLGKLS